jgi:hypothetical protein
MVNIHIVTVGFEKNKSILDAITNNHDEELNKLLQQIGNDVVNNARYNLSSNGNIDTGGLIGSIQILQTGDRFIVVGSEAPHAGYIEFGRGPVRAINAQALRFFDKKTGKLVFVKEVGPTEPSPFLQPAIEKSINMFQGLYVEKMSNFI